MVPAFLLALAVLANPSHRTGLLLPDATTVDLIQYSSGDRAHQSVQRLFLWKRIDGTPDYDASLNWVRTQAIEFGLKQIEIERFPQPRVWKPRRGELWMSEPHRISLTTYDELPFSLCRYSATTNVDAEVIDIGSGLADSDYPQSIAGKIVLTSSDPALVVEKAVRDRKAAGIVSYWTIPEWDRQNRQPHEIVDIVGWRALPPNTGAFAFMISPRRASELQSILKRKAIRLHAIVDAETVPGTMDILTAAIPGASKASEEIVLSAHLDEIGADDNASGSAVLLEVARTLNNLVVMGKLPPLPRTVRFIWGPEFTATQEWLKRHGAEPTKRLAGFNIDQCGADLVKTGAVFSMVRTPDSTPSYLNALVESIIDFMNTANDMAYPQNKEFHIISVNGTRQRLQARSIPFIAGSDHEIYNHAGIPATFFTAWPEKYYHSSLDTPDQVDPTQLHRVAFAALAGIVSIAYAEDQDVPALAGLTLSYAKKRLRDAESTAVHAALTGKHDYARQLIRHTCRREAAAIRSTLTFSTTETSRRRVETLAGLLAQDESTALAQLAQLGATGPDTISGRIPRRTEGNHLTKIGAVLARCPAQSDRIRKMFSAAEASLQESGAATLRISGFRDAPSFYADGKRTVGEIRNSVLAEYGVDLTVAGLDAYFDCFAAANAMTFLDHTGQRRSSSRKIR